MKIEVVQLENIRSHVKSTVPFTRGFNCLVGGVGCGKIKRHVRCRLRVVRRPHRQEASSTCFAKAPMGQSHGAVYPERQHLPNYPWA